MVNVSHLPSFPTRRSSDLKPHTINDRFALGKSKHSRFGIASLRLWGHRANFHKTETQATQGIEVIAVFIQPGRQPDGIRERQPHHLDRLRNWSWSKEFEQLEALGGAEQFQSDIVSDFWLKTKQQLARKRIHRALVQK